MERKIKNICVFCGSGLGANTKFSQDAEILGKYLADNNYKLIYGGANIGLMGILADAVMENGGTVLGIMPKHLVEKEVAHLNLNELIIVESMDERKNIMIEKSDAFISLPGGFGTFDELFEVLSLNQLGIIHKPCAILNVNGYYDYLLKQLEVCVNEKLLRQEHAGMIISDVNIENLFEKINNYSPEKIDKWWVKKN